MCLRVSGAKVESVRFGPVFGPLQLHEYAGHGRECQWHRDGRRWRRRDHNRDLFSVVVWCDMEKWRAGCICGGGWPGRHICIRAEFGPDVFGTLGICQPLIIPSVNIIIGCTAHVSRSCYLLQESMVGAGDSRRRHTTNRVLPAAWRHSAVTTLHNTMQPSP